MNLFDQVFSVVDDRLDGYVLSTAADIIDFITPIFTSLLIIWIAIWGYMLMFGKASEPLQDGVFRIIRIGFIMTLGLTVGTYADVVVDMLSNGPETIAAIITGSPSDSVASTLDILFSKVFEVAESAWDKGGIMNGNIGMYFLAAAVLIAGCALTLVVAFLILLSKIMTAILLAIGPLFIIMLLFNATQRFFESWLGMVVNYGLILVIGAAIGQLMVSLGDDYIDGMSGGDPDTLANLADVSMLCIVFAMCILVVKQVPSIASALGGGIAVATQGAIGSAVNSMRPSTMRNKYRGVQRDLRHTGQALGSPYRGAKRGVSAYQKRFGAGNTITGS